jgi:hypothetical protein
MRRKRSWHPRALDSDALFDPLLDHSAQTGTPYVPAVVLPPIPHRLVDPAYDDPALHLRFEPAIPQYVALTPTGECTLRRLLAEKSQAEWWEKLSRFVRDLVQSSQRQHEIEQHLANLISLVGCEVHIRAFARHWMDLLAPSTTTHPPEPTAAG